MRIFHAQHDKIKCQSWTVNPGLTKYHFGANTPAWQNITSAQINTPAWQWKSLEQWVMTETVESPIVLFKYSKVTKTFVDIESNA